MNTATYDTMPRDPVSISAVVADDSRESLLALCRYLNTQPYIELMTAARDGGQALRDIARHRPQLVILALHMEGMTGPEAAEAIRKEFPKTRIIVVSSDDHPDRRAEARASGADVFISKGDLIFELPRRISDWFGPNAATLRAEAELACI